MLEIILRYYIKWTKGQDGSLVSQLKNKPCKIKILMILLIIFVSLMFFSMFLYLSLKETGFEKYIFYSLIIMVLFVAIVEVILYIFLNKNDIAIDEKKRKEYLHNFDSFLDEHGLREVDKILAVKDRLLDSQKGNISYLSPYGKALKNLSYTIFIVIISSTISIILEKNIGFMLLWLVTVYVIYFVGVLIENCTSLFETRCKKITRFIMDIQDWQMLYHNK